MDPHTNEYLGAVAGMAETYGTNPPEAGEEISGVTAGRSWRGTVEWVQGDRVCVNTDGSWVYVPVADITDRHPF
jgi:hypothetical protein